MILNDLTDKTPKQPANENVCAICGDELALTVTERPDGERLFYYSCDKESCNERK